MSNLGQNLINALHDCIAQENEQHLYGVFFNEVYNYPFIVNLTTDRRYNYCVYLVGEDSWEYFTISSAISLFEHNDVILIDMFWE